jgi:hypothetical protein
MEFGGELLDGVVGLFKKWFYIGILTNLPVKFIDVFCTRLLSDSEKLAVLFVNFPFCYVLCNVGIFVKTFLVFLQLL